MNCNDFVPFSRYDWTFNRVGALKWNPTAFCLLASFLALGYFLSLELLILVYVTFKKRTGLYFWSIIVTTLGLILPTTGYILKEFAPSCPHVLVTIICKVGWVSNVSGFSIVLWSRLHLVIQDQRILRAALIMILINGFCMHTPIVVFEFGLTSRHHADYIRPMEIMERIQQTVFTIQETVISGLYIYHTYHFLNSGYPLHTRKIVRLLITIQALVIAFDGGLTAFDYKNMFTLKCIVHPFVYALKLKLEFIILNQLLSLISKGLRPGLKDILVSDTSSEENRANPENSGVSGQQGGAHEGNGQLKLNFITRPALVRGPSNESAHTRKSVMATAVHSVAMAPATTQSIVNAQGEEADVFDVIGRPDRDEEMGIQVQRTRSGSEFEDVEKEHLGRLDV